AAGAASAAAAAGVASASQKAVFFPVLETVWKTSSGLTLPFTVTFCCSMSMSKLSTPSILVSTLLTAPEQPPQDIATLRTTVCRPWLAVAAGVKRRRSGPRRSMSSEGEFDDACTCSGFNDCGWGPA
uniref:Uncharacterized protein n=1 Tax=Triticum urartu TaxID=4572 RepID=A0A8R7VDR0_TRIUA